MFLLGSHFGYAQELHENRFREAIFDNVSVRNNITYYLEPGTDLKMDFYSPASDYLPYRPLVVLVHGGGFDSGSKLDDRLVNLAEALGRHGFVTASINYEKQSSPTTEQELETAIYNVMRDVQTAIRFLKSKRNDWGVDTTQIYVGGLSAGASASMALQYWNHNEYNTLGHIASLDPLERAIDLPVYTSDISGLINLWGGIGDTTWIEEDTLPIIHFHGTHDNVIPYASGSFQSTGAEVFGSAAIHSYISQKGAFSELNTYVGLGHGHEANDRLMDTTTNKVIHFLADLLPEYEVPAETRDYSLSPNPCRDYLGLFLYQQDVTINQFSFYQIDGKRVWQSIPQESSSELYEFDLQHIQNGVYLLEVLYNDNRRITEKFVIQR